MMEYGNGQTSSSRPPLESTRRTPDLTIAHQPASFGIQVHRLLKVFLAFDSNEFELANSAAFVAFGP